MTETPPPRVSFRVEEHRLWVRLTLYGPAGSPITPQQVAALRGAVFGAAPRQIADPLWLDHTPWHSL